MSEKIGIKSLNGHPLIDEDARERIAALEESGVSGGGSAGGGSPVVLFIKDGNSLHCEYTAAQIVEMIGFMDGTVYVTSMPTFMLSDSADSLFPPDGSAGIMDLPMIPCVRVRPFFVLADEPFVESILLEFYGKNGFTIDIIPADNTIELHFKDS